MSTSDAERNAAKGETARVRAIWAKKAPNYDREIAPYERFLLVGGREWVCSRASGEVLEIGIGNGRNLAFYPADVRLTGIDLSPEMIAAARDRARELGREVDLRVMDAQALDLPNARFDTVVCTLALCSIPDDRRAVAEAKRVLRPGGRFLLLEHVRSNVLAIGMIQRVLDLVTVWLQGDHLAREPLAHLRAEGFLIAHSERSKLGIVERIAATRPPSQGTASAAQGPFDQRLALAGRARAPHPRLPGPLRGERHALRVEVHPTRPQQAAAPHRRARTAPDGSLSRSRVRARTYAMEY